MKKAIGQPARLRQPCRHYRSARVRDPVFGHVVERRVGPSPWRALGPVMDLYLFKPDPPHGLPALLLEECHLEFFTGAAAADTPPLRPDLAGGVCLRPALPRR